MTLKVRFAFIGAIVAGIILDQLSKILIMGANSAPMHLAPFLNVQAVLNRGVSFGLLGNLGATNLIILTLLIVLVFIRMLMCEKRVLAACSYALVISGALSNILDRIFLGGVFDFIDFHIWGHHWPTFNFADVYITMGACGLLIDSLHFGQKSRKK